MAITAAMVKELRELTGAGMMDCKKALGETDGNMDEAVEYLRKNGQAKAEKKASRETFRLQTGGVKMGECPVNTGSAEGDPAVRDFWGEYRLPFKR